MAYVASPIRLATSEGNLVALVCYLLLAGAVSGWRLQRPTAFGVSIEQLPSAAPVSSMVIGKWLDYTVFGVTPDICQINQWVWLGDSALLGTNRSHCYIMSRSSSSKASQCGTNF
jgi:hypothetical protein